MQPARVIPKSPETLSEYFRIEYDLSNADATDQARKMGNFFRAATRTNATSQTSPDRRIDAE